MNDLVLRLRKAADHYALKPYPEASPATAAEFHEAADAVVSLETRIQHLSDALSSMIDWAGELSDEYLDGDPDVRSAYRADMKVAMAALRGDTVS